jgi:hypothetical protein
MNPMTLDYYEKVAIDIRNIIAKDYNLKVDLFKAPGDGFNYWYVIKWTKEDNPFEGEIRIDADRIGPAIVHDIMMEFKKELETKYPAWLL